MKRCRYWNLEEIFRHGSVDTSVLRESINRGSAVDLVAERLEASVSQQLMADVDVGCFLSGSTLA